MLNHILKLFLLHISLSTSTTRTKPGCNHRCLVLNMRSLPIKIRLQSRCRNSTITISGRLLKRIGMMLLPSPRLTTRLVLPSTYNPPSYSGSSPCPGATIPPIKGRRNCPPCACPEKTKSTPLFTYVSNNSGRCESKILY